MNLCRGADAPGRDEKSGGIIGKPAIPQSPLLMKKRRREQGIRRVAIKNFLMYYWVDTEKGIVYITAVVYGERDQLKQLDKMDME